MEALVVIYHTACGPRGCHIFGMEGPGAAEPQPQKKEVRGQKRPLFGAERQQPEAFARENTG
jgi:hypothetical protein